MRGLCTKKTQEGIEIFSIILSATTPAFYNGIECRWEEKFVPSSLTYSFIYLILIQYLIIIIIYLWSEFGFDLVNSRSFRTVGLDGPGRAQSVNGPVHFDCSTRCGARSGVDGWGRGGRELCFDVSHGCVHESYVDTLKVQLVYFQQKKKKKRVPSVYGISRCAWFPNCVW